MDGHPATPTRRRLSLFDVLCIGINAIVGSGIFALPDDIHRTMGGWSPLAFTLCTLLLLPVALCFAELAGRHDETGGAYLYARGAFGARAGFLVGWYCWLNTFVSWAANTTLFVELVGIREWPFNKLCVVGVILALGAANYIGVKLGAWLVNLFVLGKTTAILCFLAVAAMAFEPGPLAGPLPYGVAGIGQGIYLALWPLQGFEVVPIPAGETRNPRRNVPLATVGSLVLAGALYTVAQCLLVGTYPDLGRPSDRPLVDAAYFLGPALGLVVLWGSRVSVGGFTAGSALGSPRYAQALARDGFLPHALARIHPRFDTPHLAIVTTTILSAVAGFFFDFRQLVGMSNITIVVQYFSTCAAVLVLRRTMPATEKTWVVPGGPVVPLLGAAGSLVLLTGANRHEVLFAAGALVAGLLVWALTRPARKELSR